MSAHVLRTMKADRAHEWTLPATVVELAGVEAAGTRPPHMGWFAPALAVTILPAIAALPVDLVSGLDRSIVMESARRTPPSLAGLFLLFSGVSYTNRGDLIVGQVGEHVGFRLQEPAPDVLDCLATGRSQEHQPGATVDFVDAALDQAALGENIEQPHETGAVDADERRQFFLAHAIAGFPKMDPRRPSGVGQADDGQSSAELTAPAGCKADKLKAEP